MTAAATSTEPLGAAEKDRAPGSERAALRWAAIGAYALAVALSLSALVVPRLAPCTDLPQHLAMIDVAARLLDPSAPEHASHALEPVTFNGLLHLLAAPFALVFGADFAGRALTVLAALGLALGVPALLARLGRPVALAGLFVPFVFSFSLRWGFVNFVLGLAFAVVAMLAIVDLFERPTRRAWAIAAVLGQLCATAHVLSMLCLCLLGASLAPELALRGSEGRPLAERLRLAVRRAAIALSPILVGSAWCLRVYRRQYAYNPALHEASARGDTGLELAKKFEELTSAAVTIDADPREHAVAALALVGAITLALVGVGLRLARRRVEPATTVRDAPVYGPFVAMSAAYVLAPPAFADAHLIYPRLVPLVVLGALAAAPRLEGFAARAAAVASLAIALAAGGLVAECSRAYAADTDALAELVDELPEGRRAAAIVHGGPTRGFAHNTLLHAAGHYAARKHGELAFSFARYIALPVHYRAGAAPPWPARGWEFSPRDYNPRCGYARSFDLALVRAPSPLFDEADVRWLVFKGDAATPKLLGRRDAFWAFDTHGIPSDGTP
jgi:hypothetical protein